MHPQGFAIYASPTRLPTDALHRMQDVPVPIISDCMGRLAGAIGLTPMHRAGRPMLGQALTVRTRPGDNLMIHKALELAEPGDIIVVDGDGCLNQALVGEIMLRYALTRGVGGFVIDGVIRDAAAYAASDFPCFARGINHRGPYKDGPGQINLPVSIGGLVVNPGDVVAGDADGVVAFPAADIEKLVELTRAKMAAEDVMMRDIAAGQLATAWIEETLSRYTVIRD